MSSVRGSSAGNTRGLIEATLAPLPSQIGTGLPRGIPAASLKQLGEQLDGTDPGRSSAGNTRGLIEAWYSHEGSPDGGGVFRGEYPRPH